MSLHQFNMLNYGLSVTNDCAFFHNQPNPLSELLETFFIQDCPSMVFPQDQSPTFEVIELTVGHLAREADHPRQMAIRKPRLDLHAVLTCPLPIDIAEFEKKTYHFSS